MIKIIKGTVGYRDPSTHTIVPKTAKDGPLSFDADTEARLVRKGIAVYAEAGTHVDDNLLSPDPPNESDLSKMTAKQLKEFAGSLGIDEQELNAARNKAALIALIEKARETPEEDEVDDEDALELDAAEDAIVDS